MVETASLDKLADFVSEVEGQKPPVIEKVEIKVDLISIEAFKKHQAFLGEVLTKLDQKVQNLDAIDEALDKEVVTDY